MTIQDKLQLGQFMNEPFDFSSKRSAVARASEDFMPREPTLQTLHIASVSFNSLLLGEIMMPDWDMFHVRVFSVTI